MDPPRKRPITGSKGSAPKRIQRDDTLPLIDADKSKQSSSKAAYKPPPKQAGGHTAANPSEDKCSIIVKNLDKNCDAIELLRLLSSEKAGAGNANFMVSFKTSVVSIQIPLDSSDKTKFSKPTAAYKAIQRWNKKEYNGKKLQLEWVKCYKCGREGHFTRNCTDTLVVGSAKVAPPQKPANPAPVRVLRSRSSSLLDSGEGAPPAPASGPTADPPLEMPIQISQGSLDILHNVFDQPRHFPPGIWKKTTKGKAALGPTLAGQIHKAQEILNQLETLLRNKKKLPSRNMIMELTNQFYSTIPHDFSKIKMNILDNLDVVLQKQDLCEELLQFH